MSPDGRRLFSIAKDRTMRCWDLQTRETVWIDDRPVTPYYGMAVSPNGRLIAGGKNRSVQILDAQTGELLHDIRVADEAYPRGFAFSPDGKTLIAGGGSGHLMVIDVQRGELIEQYQFADRPEPNMNASIAFHPDGRRYMVAPFSNGGKIYLREIGREEALREYPWRSRYQPTDRPRVGGGND